MNFIKKYWIFLASFAITAIIALILYRWFNKSFASIIVSIPSLFLSLFINSSREQEKLAKIQIAEKKKEKEQERFEKMLSFSLRIIFTISNYKYKKTIEFDRNNCDNEKFFKKETDGLTKYWEIIHKIYFLNIGKFYGYEVEFNYFYEKNNVTAEKSTDELWKDFCNLINDDGTKIIDILEQELPKILTPDVFDGEKLIVKDE